MKLFIGKELEGRHQGRSTLFVEGYVPAEKILQCLGQEHEQLYFGARYHGKSNSVVAEDIVEEVLAKLNGSGAPSIVTVDLCGEYLHRWVPLMRQHRRLEIMLTLPFTFRKCVADGLEELRKAGLSSRVQIKIRGAESILVLPLTDAVSNMWHGYKEDRLIWT